MTTSADVQPLVGTYAIQPVSSTFAFAVRHSGVFWFRGTLADVTGTLEADSAGVALEGVARADSISVREPAALREHLLAADFFDAGRHPQLVFRSRASRLDGDGRAEVDGELTIRGITRPVHAWGRWAPPRDAGFGLAAGLELHTSFDRREFGFDWQAQLPGGADAVGWEVEVDLDMLLLRTAAG